jgi:phage I-like protein
MQLAMLSQTTTEQPFGIAACSFEINLNQPWQQILPGSDFAAYDGRPTEVPGNKWRINDESGTVLAARLNARAESGQRLLFDYDHQTLLAKENGQKAPASAWGEMFEWRPGQGLFAKLKFTPAAREHIKNDEYKFYSPVVMYNKATGQVIDLHSAALTNDPAVKGMAEAAALNANLNTPPTEPKPMNEALALLFGLLGIDVDTKQDIDAAALHAQLTKPDVKAKVAALKATVEGAAESENKIAALSAQVEAGGAVDISQHVPVATYNAVVTELAALKADHEALTVDQVIDQAQKDGKFISQAELSYLKDLGNSNMAALKTLIDSRPTIAALNGKQTAATKAPDAEDKTGVAALTADQKSIADQLGISHEDYAETLKRENA